MNLVYTRTRPNATQIEGVFFLPGTHTIEASDATIKKIKGNAFFKSEIKAGRIVLEKEINTKELAADGTISLKELEDQLAIIENNISEIENKLEEAKEKKQATKDIKEELAAEKAKEKETKEAISIRKKEIEEKKKKEESENK